MKSEYELNWSDLAFASKKSIKDLNATFIAAPREMSTQRLTQLIKENLPKGNIILGLAEEPYIAGFENQPQFRTLQFRQIKNLVDKVNLHSKKQKIYTLRYSQRDFGHLLDKLDFQRIVLVNGSWKYAFHTQKPFYTISKKKTPISMVSPFADEKEAKEYYQQLKTVMAKNTPLPKPATMHNEPEMLKIASEAAKYSFDYNFQTGLSLGRCKSPGKYEFLTATHNKVVPFETYAMHYGASREKNFSPPHDLNHYDTVHAEVDLIIKAATEGIDLSKATLFINLLPCPTCSRMFTQTPISEFVYTEDHSDGYAVMMLEAAGKKVRRLVPQKDRSKP